MGIVKRLTKKQAGQLVKIGRAGKCAGTEISKKALEDFQKRRKLDAVQKFLPNASEKIRKRLSVSTRLGIRNPVLDYFFKEHNAVLNEVLKNKRTADALKHSGGKVSALNEISACKVGVGKVVGKKGKKFEVEMPDMKKVLMDSDVVSPSGFVITHSGFIVDNASKREYKKYSKYY